MTLGATAQRSPYLQPGPRSRRPGGPPATPGDPPPPGPRPTAGRWLAKLAAARGGLSAPTSRRSLGHPAFPGAPGGGAAPGHSPRIRRAAPGEPERARGAGRGGRGKPQPPATPAAPRDPRSPRAPAVGRLQRGAQPVRVSAHRPESRRFRRGRVCGARGAWARFRVSGAHRDAGDRAPRVRERPEPAPRRRGRRRGTPARPARARPPARTSCWARVASAASRPRPRRPLRPGDRGGWWDGGTGGGVPVPAGPRPPGCTLCSQRARAPREEPRGAASPPPLLPPSSLPAPGGRPVPGSAGGLGVGPPSPHPAGGHGVSLRLGARQEAGSRPGLPAPAPAPPLGIGEGRSPAGGNVASLCKRKETLPPSWRRLPRVTRRETRPGTACGFDLASDGPVGGRGTELGAHAARSSPLGARAAAGVPAAARGPARGSPRGAVGGEDGGGGRARKEGTAFQARVTRN